MTESLFQLKVSVPSIVSAQVRRDQRWYQFTAKSLQRQAKKANKDETTEKNKVKLVCHLHPIYFRVPLSGEGRSEERLGD